MFKWPRCRVSNNGHDTNTNNDQRPSVLTAPHLLIAYLAMLKFPCLVDIQLCTLPQRWLLMLTHTHQRNSVAAISCRKSSRIPCLVIPRASATETWLLRSREAYVPTRSPCRVATARRSVTGYRSQGECGYRKHGHVMQCWSGIMQGDKQRKLQQPPPNLVLEADRQAGTAAAERS